MNQGTLKRPLFAGAGNKQIALTLNTTKQKKDLEAEASKSL